MLKSVGSQRVGHDLVTEQQQQQSVMSNNDDNNNKQLCMYKIRASLVAQR